MTASHPYPSHVFEAAMNEIRTYTSCEEAAHAATFGALTALWEADHPSTLSVDEARTIWDLAVAAYRDDAGAMNILRVLLVKHAPDWGEPDGD